MDSTFGVIEREMEGYAQKPEYKNLVKKMINYAKSILGNEIIVHCRTKDTLIIKEMNVSAGTTLNNTLGGILAENKEGTRELDLTFEELLRTKEDDIKSFLVERFAR